MASFEDILKRVTDNFGKAAADAVPLYLPAVKRLSLDELVSWTDLVFTQNNNDAALARLREKMTPEELTIEKGRLATMTALMADRNAEKWMIGNALMSMVFKAVVSCMVASEVLL